MLAYAKAFVATLVAFLSSLVVATTDGGHISTNEWLVAAVAGLVALGAVFAVPNKPGA